MVVLAAIDRSERAEAVISEAHRLAGDAGQPLHVVHVGETQVPNPAGGYDAEHTEFISREQARAIARDIAAAVLPADAFEAVGLEGDPIEELLAYADEQDAVYIVVSARKRTPVGQAVFGSVTQSAILQADCPVLAVPPATD